MELKIIESLSFRLMRRRAIVSAMPFLPSFDHLAAVATAGSPVYSLRISTPSLKSHAYVLAVHDLAGSTAYFEDALGFSKEWNDDDNWQGLVRDGVRLMLGRCPDALAPAATGDHSYFGFFTTEDVDRLHDEFVSRGANIISAPTAAPPGLCHGLFHLLPARGGGFQPIALHRYTSAASRTGGAENTAPFVFALPHALFPGDY